MANRVAIVQSSYIPWKGYFDLIRAADEFVLLDDVQFTIRDWRSRNRIKARHGPLWLSVPVHAHGRPTIADVVVSDPRWGERHWRSIHASYGKTPWFGTYAPRLEPLFRTPVSTRLSEINRSLLEAVCAILGIATRFRASTEFTTRHDPTERLLDICLAAGAREYLSGPRARAYLDVGAFKAAGIEVTFVDYGGYAEYEQPYPPFEHQVSVLDLMFCTGPRALEYMKSF